MAATQNRRWDAMTASAAPAAEMEQDLRILAVDDHQPFRDALRDLITAAPGCVQVGQACSGEEAVRACERLSPLLVLMDVAMPGMDGIAAARLILSRDPGTVILLISVEDPADYPGASDLGSTVACARKQDLRPSELRRVWETHKS
jgi:DNA-binding NarL/FixJ family response regulator